MTHYSNQIDYQNNLEKRLVEFDKKKMMRKESIEKQHIKKYNYLTMQREDNYEKTIRFEKMQDYLKQKKMEKINERMVRIDNLQ